jgi:hypothetical protein
MAIRRNGVKRGRPCAYCGSEAAQTVDHVVSKALYPTSKASSRTPRITVPACKACNGGWVDDEPHFRNVLLVAGEPNALVRELWQGKTRRSFEQPDGRRRARDLTEHMEPIETPEGPRHLIYPARDQRVLRIVRKVVRGLCHHHGLISPVSDDQVVADIQRFEIPPAFQDEMVVAHAEADILVYRYSLVDDPHMHSGWVLNFFERTLFFCIVFRSSVARRLAEAEAVRPGSDAA